MPPQQNKSQKKRYSQHNLSPTLGPVSACSTSSATAEETACVCASPPGAYCHLLYIRLPKASLGWFPACHCGLGAIVHSPSIPTCSNAKYGHCRRDFREKGRACAFTLADHTTRSGVPHLVIYSAHAFYSHHQCDMWPVTPQKESHNPPESPPPSETGMTVQKINKLCRAYASNQCSLTTENNDTNKKKG